MPVLVLLAIVRVVRLVAGVLHPRAGTNVYVSQDVPHVPTLAARTCLFFGYRARARVYTTPITFLKNKIVKVCAQRKCSPERAGAARLWAVARAGCSGWLRPTRRPVLRVRVRAAPVRHDSRERCVFTWAQLLSRQRFCVFFLLFFVAVSALSPHDGACNVRYHAHHHRTACCAARRRQVGTGREARELQSLRSNTFWLCQAFSTHRQQGLFGWAA